MNSSLLEAAARVGAREQRPNQQRDSSRLEVCRRKKLNSRLRKNRVPDPRVKAGCAQLPGEAAPSAMRFVLLQSNEPARKCRLAVDWPAARSGKRRVGEEGRSRWWAHH